MCLHLLSACCLRVCVCVCTFARMLWHSSCKSWFSLPITWILGSDPRCYPLSHGSVTFYEAVGIEGFVHTSEALCAELRPHENPQCPTDVTIPLRPRYSRISTRV